MTKEIHTIQEKVKILARFPQIQDGDTETSNEKLTEVAPQLNSQISPVCEKQGRKKWQQSLRLSESTRPIHSPDAGYSLTDRSIQAPRGGWGFRATH